MFGKQAFCIAERRCFDIVLSSFVGWHGVQHGYALSEVAVAEVWAFGCVVYEMCTLRQACKICKSPLDASCALRGWCNRHPFEAKNQAALLIKILRGQLLGGACKLIQGLGYQQQL